MSARATINNVYDVAVGDDGDEQVMRTCISLVERNYADPRQPFTRDRINSTEEAWRACNEPTIQS